jgi:hypothetical protein
MESYFKTARSMLHEYKSA